jgi:hypothetical protein
MRAYHPEPKGHKREEWSLDDHLPRGARRISRSC